MTTQLRPKPGEGAMQVHNGVPVSATTRYDFIGYVLRQCAFASREVARAS